MLSSSWFVKVKGEASEDRAYCEDANPDASDLALGLPGKVAVVGHHDEGMFPVCSFS